MLDEVRLSSAAATLASTHKGSLVEVKAGLTFHGEFLPAMHQVEAAFERPVARRMLAFGGQAVTGVTASMRWACSTGIADAIASQGESTGAWYELIRLAGHSPDEIGIDFSGLRAGEKLYEELLADADTTVATAVRQLRLATLQPGDARLEPLLELARAADAAVADDEVRQRLQRVVGEYRPVRG